MHSKDFKFVGPGGIQESSYWLVSQEFKCQYEFKAVEEYKIWGFHGGDYEE
jgi:hypothetical protein